MTTQHHQRLPLKKLHAYEALGYGIFLHFGMSSYLGQELPDGLASPTAYAPDALDVEQWIAVARDNGMRYAILTAKHVAGHCLWPSEHTDYHVGNSPDKTDVCERFVKACRNADILPGLYYCSWDNHHNARLDGIPPCARWADYQPNLHPHTGPRYRDFMTAQIEELLRRYQPGILWIDIPAILPPDYRRQLYNHIATLSPETIVTLNHNFNDGSRFDTTLYWPCDVTTMEQTLPTRENSTHQTDRHGYQPVKNILGKNYYIPCEYCDSIGRHWFWREEDQPLSPRELLGMQWVARSRGCNFLLNIPPEPSGRIPEKWLEPLRTIQNISSHVPEYFSEHGQA